MSPNFHRDFENNTKLSSFPKASAHKTEVGVLTFFVGHRFLVGPRSPNLDLRGKLADIVSFQNPYESWESYYAYF
jgi:hypothetical protein